MADSVIINGRNYIPEDNCLPKNWKTLLFKAKKHTGFIDIRYQHNKIF